MTATAVTWRSSIDDLEPGLWERCFGAGDVLRSRALQRAVERSGLDGVRFHYLHARLAGRPLLVPCFEYRVSPALLAPPAVQRLVERVQRVVPALRDVRLFVAGSPVAICTDLLGLQAFDDPGLRRAALRGAVDLVADRARDLGGGFVVVKEIRAAMLAEARAALDSRMVFLESLPTTFVGLSGPGVETYEQRLRTKYRVLMKRRRRAFRDAGLEWRLEHDFARHADAMHRLYLQVWERSAHRFERLTPEFFRQVSRELGDGAFALLCQRGDRLVAFELFLGDDEWLQPVYLGIDYAVRDDAALYFNALYRILEEVERRGYPVVQLGQTSYDAKAALGAVVSRLHIAVDHPNAVVRRAIRQLGGSLFPSAVAPVRAPFRDPALHADLLARRSVDFEAA